MLKKLSLKGLATYMTASPTRQRTILREYKYPSEGEARAKILYYREARDRIACFHRSPHDESWLYSEAKSLEDIAGFSVGPRKTRFQNNARGIRQYAKSFANRKFEILDEFCQDLQFDDVHITVYPDLHIIEKDKEKIVKLEFSRSERDIKEIKIISQCMFEAAKSASMDVASSSILFFDVPRGKEYKGARMGSRMAKDIEAVCKNISAIWDTI